MKLSIITINFNNLSGLKRTVDSVISQTWQNFEYIVIDGGSTDGSVKFIEEHRQKLTFWKSEPDRGIYHAMNKGVKVATGEYLLFLNSGDELYNRDVINSSIAELYGEDILSFNIIYRGIQDILIEHPDSVGFEFFWNKTLSHPSTFIKSELFLKIQYDEDLLIVSDWKFFLIAVLELSATYRKINFLLSIFFTDGISSAPENSSLILNERRIVLMERFPWFCSELNDLERLRNFTSLLKASRKIKILQKIGLVNKF
jgi:glycosyltransferase involved in cell wall biosynthesis